MSDREPNWRLTDLHHVGLTVSDIEESIRFYRDVLGMRLDFIKDSPEDSYSHPVFEIDHQATMRFAVLSTETQVRTMALTEVKGIELPPVPHPRRPIKPQRQSAAQLHPYWH